MVSLSCDSPAMERRIPALAMALVMLSVVHLSGLATTAEAARIFPDSVESVLRLFSSSSVAPVREYSSEACGPQLSIETPSCTVEEKKDGYELRKYPKGQMWVETVVSNSSYTVATTVGFFRCFNFISGNNDKKEEINMTGPVLIKPVVDASGYKVSFFAPSRFSANEFPNPLDPNVNVVQTEEEVHAVLGPFGGFPAGAEYAAKWQDLKSKLDEDGLDYDESTVVYAGYSSPFEVFNRKQEVHVSLK